MQAEKNKEKTNENIFIINIKNAYFVGRLSHELNIKMERDQVIVVVVAVAAAR